MIKTLINFIIIVLLLVINNNRLFLLIKDDATGANFFSMITIMYCLILLVIAITINILIAYAITTTKVGLLLLLLGYILLYSTFFYLNLEINRIDVKYHLIFIEAFLTIYFYCANIDFISNRIKK